MSWWTRRDDKGGGVGSHLGEVARRAAAAGSTDSARARANGVGSGGTRGKRRKAGSLLADTARRASARPISAAGRASGARYAGQARSYAKTGRTPGLDAQADIGVSDDDLLRDLAVGYGIDPTAGAIADMIAGSVPAPPQLDIAGALAPYDQAVWSVTDQANKSLDVLRGIQGERVSSQGQNNAAHQARLRELAERTGAGIEQLNASSAADAQYGAADLAAQGVDPGYAAAAAGARSQSNAGIADAQNANVDFERAMAERAMADEASMNASLDQGSRANLETNKTEALRDIAMAKAQAEAQLRQAQAQLEAQFAQDQTGAAIDAAKFAMESGGDPLARQQEIMGLISQAGPEARVFPGQAGVQRELEAYDPDGSKMADDYFLAAAGEAGNAREFEAILNQILIEDGAARREGGEKPRNWDRDWFRRLAQRYFEPGNLTTEAANDLRRYMLSGGAASQPFGGVAPHGYGR